jgi:predicted dehydrogenase
VQRSENNDLSRRDLLKTTGTVAAASALAGVAWPAVHTQGPQAIQLALVGCGGRGTGAALDALNSRNGPTRLVAMADVFRDRLAGSYQTLNSSPHAAQVAVPQGRRFLGFDGYRHAMDALNPGDVVILATPPAFRWVHFDYAIRKRLNVFMEKPVTVDGPSSRRMLALAAKSEFLNLKVGVGLMCRHCAARKELFQRIQGGEIGDLILMRAYRLAGPTAYAFVEPRPRHIPELLYQIRNFHGFLWASGGAFSDFLIHNIDECCWMKNAWPISAKGSGGRHYRGNYIDQNFDSYSTEYTFADGTKLYLEGRCIQGCHQEFASYVHGTRGSAIVSQSGHTPSHCRTFRGQNFTNGEVVWRCPAEEPNPYQLEWDDLLDAIRRDVRYNEVRRGVEASVVTAMGRMACHTGRVVTRDQMLNHQHDLAPGLAELTFLSAAPVVLQGDGKYPVPQPGIVTQREY